jgi:chromosome segregation ATPase
MTPTTGPADPLRALEEQLASLRGQDEKLAQSLEDTRGARRKLAGQIRSLEASLSLVRSGGKPADTQLASGTIADAIEVLLRAQGEMRAIELTEALQNAGKLLRTDSAYATLHKTLARDARFGKVTGRRGYWALVVHS